MPPFTITPLLESEIPAFATIDCAAMSNWPLAKAMSIHSPVPRHDLITAWVRESFSADPTQVYMKARDAATGEIVACALWRFREGGDGEVEAEGEVIKTRARAGSEDGGVEEERKEMQAAPGGIGEEMKASWLRFQATHFPGRPYAHLQILITHPTHQRRGAGSALTAWGCARADEKHLLTVLTASDAGLRTYLKAGFEVVEEYELDLRPFGVEAMEVRRWMVRRAREG